MNDMGCKWRWSFAGLLFKLFRERGRCVSVLGLICVAQVALAQPSSPPTVSTIPDQGVYPNGTNRLIAFTVNDAATPSQQLTVVGLSANTNLVPTSGLVFGGNFGNRTLTIIPAANATGTTTVTVIATDTQGGSSSNVFAVDVNWFTPVSSGLPALGEGRAVWGDHDNDGRLDVLATGFDGTNYAAYIFRNNPNGVFTNLNAGLTNAERGLVAWVDYNRDGRLDALLTGGYPQNPPQLYRNDGGGVFAPVNPGLPYIHNGGSFGAVAWGDFDNDGNQDIALSGQSTNLTPSTFISRNNGNDTFTIASAGLPGAAAGSLDWGDYDNDGDLDLVLSGRSPGSVYVAKVFRNDGKGVFSEAVTNFPTVYLGVTLWGDYDNDGDSDLLLAGSIGDYNPVSRIYRNDGGMFTDIGAGLTGFWFAQGAWADFDNDGDLDAILGGRDPSGVTVTKLYRNNGNQTFTEVSASLLAIQSGSYSWGDYDNDGDLDLLVMGLNCNFGCQSVQLYRNNGPTNAPPTTPAGLNVTLLPGNDVALRWNASTDARTASNGISYNLRIGTNSGGIQISSPQSDLATGFRRVPQSGFAHTNRWKLVNLAKGTYYWSVQAVDPTYAGSPFSTQGTFTISNSRPFISAISNVVTSPNVAVSNVSFTVSDAETAATSLVVTKSSSNTNLLPSANILLGGSGSNRTVTLIPTGNRSGEAVVTLTVTDSGGLMKSTNFALRVEAFTALPPIGPPPLSTNHFIYETAWLPAVDYDKDGDLDIPFKRLSQVTNPIYETFFLRNDGGDVFTPVEAGLTNILIKTVAWGDVDNDGGLDALIIGSSQVTNNSFSFTRLYRNSGSSFELMPVSLPRFYNGVAAIADVNGDGLADLFLSGAKDENGYPQATVILLNNGSGGFAEWKTDLPFISAARVFWVDMDNDGDLDLLSEIQYTTRIFRNDHGGKFTEITSGLGAMSVETAGNPMDLDNDGLLDVFMSGYYAGVIKRNQGDGTFSSWSTSLTNLAYGSAPVMADYDNDGWADIHMALPGGTNRLYRNHGNLTFSLADTNVPAGWFADLDGDSDLDVVANGILWRNNSAVANTPPAAPAGLQSTQPSGDAVQLTWTRSADAQTTNATGLYYNLRVGTTPGGAEVLSPLADPATGQRRVVGLGNASQTNRWVLRDLPRGTYHWSVQAMDTAFAGSPFSTNATFTVTRPQISEIADQKTAPGFPLALPFSISDVETPAGSLALSATSANTNLVALTNIVFSGSGTNRTVTLSPTPGLTGTNTITITVTDGNGFTDSTAFTLIVMPFLPLGNLTIDTWDSVFPADYNNDGLMDVLVSADQVQLWRNLGNGQFTNDATGLPAWHYGPAAWGDFDNDGWLDLALADAGNVFRNTGTNHFVAVTNGLYEGSCCYKNVAWGDYDGDGRLDLVRVGDTSYSTALLRNTGNGTFTNSGFVPAWGYSPALGWADLDNDGQLELFVSASKSLVTYGNEFTYIYRYNGGTNFTLVSSNALLTARFPTVGFRDFDGDDDLDILIAGERASGATCRVYRNEGNFNFTNVSDLGASVGRNAAWGDYNNDGRPDILSYAAQPTTVFLNHGDSTFTNLQANLTTVELDNAAWADFDNDGDLDVLSGKLYANLVPVSNQPPQAPFGLSASIISNRVVLSWNAPVDDTTSSNAFTYAVRLGTNSGSSQFLAADADPDTGFRRAVPDVSAWPNRSRSVRGLPDGNYYWSVQAIDAGYAGSPFAAEASLSYFHPTVSMPASAVAYAGAPSVIVPLVVGDADSAASTLTVAAFSSNTNFLNATNIVLGGSGSNRTATITLPANSVGTSTVSVVVTDLTGLTGTNSFTFTSDYFSQQTLALPGGVNGTPSLADIDGDGDLDLYLAGTIYQNNDGTNFVPVTTVLAGQRHGVAWADYDRDGDLDLAVAGGGPTKVYRNEGGAAFIDSGAVIPDAGNAAIAWGDYDNDGDPDLVSLGNGLIYRNDGTRGFAGVSAGLPAVGESSVAWGDFDEDGDQDILLAGFQGPSTPVGGIYRNNGNGTFTSIGAGLPGFHGASVDWGDYDNDGDLDVLVCGVWSTFQAHVFQNLGNGTFALTNDLPGVAYGVAQWVDFDNDSQLDIFLCGNVSNYPNLDYASRLYRNNGDGTFSDTQSLLPKGSTATWGDLEGDSDLDLMISGYGMETYPYRLLQNGCTTSNTPPAAPTNPVAMLLPDNNVMLSWSPSGDLESTNAASLNYAVRAGTNSGGVSHLSPHANGVNGDRYLAQRGPRETNACILRDVPKGTYFWSVQAVDAGFIGSAFANEGTFAITNARPAISAVSNQFTVPGHATPSLAFTISDEETLPANLTLTGLSTNTALVPNGNIVFGGSGSNRTVTVTPLAGQSGTTTITISVMDAQGLVATTRFDVVVQTFTDLTNGLPSSLGSAPPTAWGDYDNDGDLDVSVVGFSFTTVYRNTNGFFTNQNFTLPATTASDLQWLDFDNDGDLDLAESGWLSSGYLPATLRFRNNFPTNTLTGLSTNLPGSAIANIADGAMAWADYDNDGDLDVLLAGDTNTYHTPDAFTVLTRNDRGVFTNSGVALPALVRGAATWGDYDNDGDLDLLLAGQTGSIATNSLTKLFRNEGNGAFTEIATPFPGLTDCSLAFGDMDNDGDLDVAMAGLSTDSVALTRIYRNLGNGAFTNLDASLAGVRYASVAWGDYDNDGFADLVVSGSTNIISPVVRTKVYYNSGGAAFLDIGGTLLGGPSPTTLTTSWGDYDNDGDLDLLAGARLARNNWNLANTPPTTPTNLSFLLLSNSAVQLAWSPSSDLETTNARGLNYNLRLGTTPGGIQIVSPLSSPVTGYRRVPQPGNAGQTNVWRIYNLTNGTYYWSVQAADPGYTASSFATEGTFTLSRPVFSAITNRSVAPNTVVGPIAFTVSDAETAASNLVLSAWSSDTNLVANGNLILAGNGISRTLTVTPATNRSGTVTIMIVATDESGESGSVSFQITYERFADINAGFTGTSGPVAWGDFDNDGDLDLFRGSTVYRSVGNHQFNILSSPIIPNEGLGGWGDYDNDGNLDALIVGANSSRIYRGNGSNNFTDINAGLGAAGLPRQSGAWGDFDNDGDQDVLLAAAGFTRVYRNHGNGTFTDIGAGLPSVSNGQAAWCDYDKDGDLDILMAGSGQIRVYVNNGNGTFTSIAVTLPVMYYASVAWADYDNDGWMDFAVAGSTNNQASGTTVRLFRNTVLPTAGSRTFTNVPSFQVQGVWKGAIAWGDYDSDGDQDLLISGETVLVPPQNLTLLSKIYRNDNGSFVDSGHGLPGFFNPFVAWGDYDNDGLLDLAISGNGATGAPFSRIYRNYGNVTNLPPGAPVNLTCLVTRKSIRLSWGAASDANQPAAALTYNLRVGTSPGAGNVLNPLSLPDGLRKVAASGNTQERQSWTLTNLIGGTYYWSVQAVDASFAGSPFAAEGTVVVSNIAPSAVSQSIITTEDVAQSIVLTGLDQDTDPITFSISTPPLFGQLTGTPPNVTYRPLTNYFGFDLFEFRANDRTTDSPPATVSIEVTPVEDVAGSSLSLDLSGGGPVQLQLLGEPWRSYRIEVSDDLVHWTLLTNILCTNLLTELMDSDSAIFPQRFYRAAEFTAAPMLGAVVEASPNLLKLLISGEPGRNYQLQASTDLVTWTWLTNICVTNAASTYSDPDASKFPSRFYRVVAP
jgi:hypothetical protein